MYCTIYYVLSLTIVDPVNVYRVSQEECARLRESVSYVKVYRYNSKHRGMNTGRTRRT